MRETISRSLRSRIAHIPVFGYLLRLGWCMMQLPKQLDHLHATAAGLDKRLGLNQRSLTTLEHQFEQTVAEQHNKAASINEQLSAIKHRLLAAKLPKSGAAMDAKAVDDLLADDHELDDFYIQFENKFRGTEAEIKERLRVYIPHFKNLQIDFAKHPIIDVGCGRGEFLNLLREQGLRAIGLDINESMVERCMKQGLEAVQGDALQYLAQQKTDSIGAVVGIHIVEHIPFSFLLRLFDECYRVLTPGGIVIFETPNPENLHVGSFSFYYDPSHLHPLPPDMLAFAIANRGFDKTDILRLHPKGDGKENSGRKDVYVNEVVRRFFMAQDYAIIGTKTGPSV